MFSVLLALAGCPDPQGRFDEFANRFPDAATTPDAKGGIVADISGSFLYSIFVAATPTLAPPQAIATVAITSQDPLMASFQIQFLTLSGRMPTGDPSMYSDVAVDSMGRFTINIPSLTILAAANALATDVTATNVVIAGTIHTSDFFCGTLGGIVMPGNIDLAGSTFGAVRVEAGQTGASLPAPILDCAHEPANADAGTSAIDAGT